MLIEMKLTEKIKQEEGMLGRSRVSVKQEDHTEKITLKQRPTGSTVVSHSKEECSGREKNRRPGRRTHTCALRKARGPEYLRTLYESKCR